MQIVVQDCNAPLVFIGGPIHGQRYALPATSQSLVTVTADAQGRLSSHKYRRRLFIRNGVERSHYLYVGAG